MEGKQLLLFLYVGGGLLLVILSIPLLLEKIRSNPFNGFRIARTLESLEIWYAADKYAAKNLVGVGVISI